MKGRLCVSKEHLDGEHYSKWLAPLSTQRPDGKQRCNVCYAGEDLKRKEVDRERKYFVVNDDSGVTPFAVLAEPPRKWKRLQ